MEAAVFDSRELQELEKEFMGMAKRYPKEIKKFLRKQGSELNKRVKRKAKARFKKKSGRYIKGFKRGRPYKVDGIDTIRVYNSQPHAHLLEEGHRIVDKNGQEHGFKKGAHILEETKREYSDDFYAAMEDTLDDIVKSGGF